MRTLIVSEFMTLDGVVEAPGGEPTHPHTGWVGDFFNEEQLEYKLAETQEADSLLLGRKTYEGFAAAWPKRDGPFADKMNAMPKHVATSTLQQLDWNNSTVLSGPVPAVVSELKQGTGGPILVAGSATLVHTLVEHNLADEYRLMIFPVLIGGGLRLFPDNRAKTTLKLVDTVAFGSGVVVQTYRPA